MNQPQSPTMFPSMGHSVQGVIDEARQEGYDAGLIAGQALRELDSDTTVCKCRPRYRADICDLFHPGGHLNELCYRKVIKDPVKYADDEKCLMGALLFISGVDACRLIRSEASSVHVAARRHGVTIPRFMK